MGVLKTSQWVLLSDLNCSSVSVKGMLSFLAVDFLCCQAILAGSLGWDEAKEVQLLQMFLEG